MNRIHQILLQADGQIYNRSWLIWLVLLLIVAGSWFAWHRNRSNIRKRKEQGTRETGEVIV